MSQVSSSFLSYYDERDDSTNATEYYDIDDVDNDGSYEEYDEPEDHDNECIDMSGIPEDATFEEPELACMLENLQNGKKGSSKGFQRGKKGWSKGESHDVLKAGKGGRPENCKQVRWKLQSDRVNRGWKDQPAHGTNKGRGRSQLAQMDDLLARTRWFKCGELGHLTKDCPQNKEPTTKSETFFSGMVYNDSCNVHPRNEFCAGHCRDNYHLVSLETIVQVFLVTTVLVFLETILVLVTLETNPVLTMTLETNAVCMLILETLCVLKLTFGPVMRQSRTRVRPVCYRPVRQRIRRIQEVQRVTAGNNSWDQYDYRDKWTDVWKSGHDGNRWIHGWNEYYHGDVWTDAWRERNSGFVCQHNDDNLTDAWNKCKPDDEWRASHWETSSWSSSHWETSGMERRRRVQRRSQTTAVVKSFLLRDNEHGPVDQLPLQVRCRCHFLWN